MSLVKLRQTLARDEGQTIVLGAISMLILAVAVMATVNIGHMAYERIKLQNAVDNTAYSLAATQARAFNFFAYTNRAMICHYNSMLTLMAYLSYILYMAHTWGRLIKTLGWIADIFTLGALTPIIQAISKGIDWAVKIADKAVAVGIPVLGGINYVYGLFQAGMLAVMEVQLVTEPQVASASDPKAQIGISFSNLSGADVLPALFKLSNAWMANKAVDWKSIKRIVRPKTNAWGRVVDYKSGNGPGNQARMVMTELVNNARHSWVAGTQDSLWNKLNPFGRFFGDTWSLGSSLPGPLKFLAKIADVGVTLKKRARTEMGMRPGGSKADYDQIYSVDTLEFSIFAKAGVKVTLGFKYRSEAWADYNKGGHDEDVEPIFEVSGCPWPLSALCKAVLSPAKKLSEKLTDIVNKAIDVYLKALENGGKHHFSMGITPYMKFNPSRKWKQAFNQPDYLVFGYKSDKNLEAIYQREIALDVGVDGSRIVTERGTDSRISFVFDEDLKGSFLSKLMPGLNAMAMARTYYHRPGEWKEQPNFFNPFWGAKLEGIMQHPLPSTLGISDIANDWILTH